MRFRPCIDIHDGKVKQLVGATISDLAKTDDGPKENYVSTKEASYYSKLFKKDGLTGGHIILLNKKGTAEYEATKKAALDALAAFPGGMQVGGGIDLDNALEFIEAGASHVIVTSFVFNNGRVDWDALKALSDLVGRERLVLDLSCKRVDDKYMVVTDRWQKTTEEIIDYEFLDRLAVYCDEFLVHAADVEGQQQGIDRDLAYLLGRYKQMKITYAGGISDYADIELISYMSDNKLDFTIGSALDLYGGNLSYEKILNITNTAR